MELLYLVMRVHGTERERELHWDLQNAAVCLGSVSRPPSPQELSTQYTINKATCKHPKITILYILALCWAEET